MNKDANRWAEPRLRDPGAEMSSGSPPHSGVLVRVDAARRALFLLGGAALLGLLSGLWLFGSYNGWTVGIEEPLVSLGDALGTGLIDWLLWLPSWPLVCALARRWPVRRPHLLGALGIHAAAAPLLSLFQLALFALVTVAVRAALYDQDPRLGLGTIVLAALSDSFRWKFRSGVLVALIASAAVQAGDARRATLAQELRSESLRRRLRTALDRVRRARTPSRREVPASPALDDRVVVAAGGRIASLRLRDVDWIAAAGNYLRFHGGGRTHLGRGTLEGIQARAAGHGFVRVHRSRLVRVDSLSSVESAGSGDLLLHLHDGTRLRASRRYRSVLLHSIGARAARPVEGAVRPSARDRRPGPT